MSMSEIMTLINSNPTTPLNELIENLMSSSGGGVIKSIQRGSVNASTQVNTITISPVNMGKSIVRISYVRYSDNRSADRAAYGWILSENSILVSFATGTANYFADWEVIEFY